MRTNVMHSGEKSVDTRISEGDNSGLTGLTTEQWWTLVKLLNAQKTNSNDKMTSDCSQQNLFDNILRC